MSEEHGSNKTNFIVWIVLVILTAIEVFLAYKQIDQVLMLILLMGFSIIKAVLIIAFFMHMKFERLSFILTVIPATVLTITLIAVIYPEGYRIRKFLAPADEPSKESHDHDHGDH